MISYVVLCNIMTFFVETVAFHISNGHNSFCARFKSKVPIILHFLKGGNSRMEAFEAKQSGLEMAILIKKREMIETGLTYGLTDQKTIKCSQQLDKLLNMYKSTGDFKLTG
ncbi:aspartyl-phosphate phosphatase Spo0E family protein [Lentibacillus jeotgali]|uniref:aspartyl-phosphate phosphatase Spo0E family protein n=1 Tax=Lentibacillus jeotgali TaxID=558169 RepID=UPI001FE14780|nr:aspartyl-phosphate phosphatase Spo0E family protein [Lentibacillus jeotgali]